MNWLVKVAAFKFLSALPGGARFYRYCQEHVTHSLTPARARLEQKMGIALQYWDWLQAHECSHSLLHGTHLDFGTGWHPTIPLLYYSMGTGHQLLFDVAAVMDSAMVRSTVQTFRAIVSDPEWPHRARLQRLPEPGPAPGHSVSAYLKGMGMSYHAPYENTFNKIAGSVDVVTSTQVLYYIPREVLKRCFDQIHRSLKKQGKFLATIHLIDGYATAGTTLSPYNHLKFSPETWERWVNSSIMSCNRLRAADYRQLLEETGFDICHFEVEGPTTADLCELDKIPIHDSFRHFSREELGAKHLFFVAQKK